MSAFVRPTTNGARRARLAMAALFVMSLAIGWLAVLAPARAVLAERRQHAASVQASLVRARTAAARRPQLEEEVRALASTLDRSGPALPSELDREDLLRRLTELATATHLHLSRYAPKPPVMTPEYAEWAIDLTFDGTYADLRRFFGRVEASPELMAVTDFEIKAGAVPTSDRSVVAQCTATAFVWTTERSRGAPAPHGVAGSSGGRS